MNLFVFSAVNIWKIILNLEQKQLLEIILQGFKHLWGLKITLWDATHNSEERKRSYVFLTISSLKIFSSIVLSNRHSYFNVTIHTIFRERFAFTRLISLPASRIQMWVKIIRDTRKDRGEP